MKNIQVIDGALNAVYDIFQTTEEEFAVIFPSGQDVAFISEVMEREGEAAVSQALSEVWSRRVKKAEVNGIHGLLFYELDDKMQFYPSRRDEEAINPNGSSLR